MQGDDKRRIGTWSRNISNVLSPRAVHFIRHAIPSGAVREDRWRKYTFQLQLLTLPPGMSI